MTQSLRNKIYAVAASVFGVLVVLGVVDAATSQEALTLLDHGLSLAVEVIGLVTNVIAFAKSLPSRVTVVEHPRGVTER